MLLTQLACLALSFLSLGVTSEAASSRRATTCNGHAELCSRSYGNVSFVGAHDSYAVGVNNAATNQDYNVTQQLNDGVRLLQMQAHNSSGVIQLCHTLCILYNGGTLQDYLTKVKTWMDANPNDVVTLLIVNSDNFAASKYGEVFAAVGLDKISFTPASSSLAASAWPTLGDMIDKGTRLVTFLDNGADFTSVPYLIDEFSNVWETPFDVTTSFDCSVNRTHSNDPTTQMYLINHFLDTLLGNNPIPDPTHANTTNAVSGPNSLGDQVQLCTTQYGRPPNYLLVDFYEYGGGSVFQVAATINGVTYSPTSPIATPITSGAAAPTQTSQNSASVSFERIKLSLVLALNIAIGASFVV